MVKAFTTKQIHLQFKKYVVIPSECYIRTETPLLIGANGCMQIPPNFNNSGR